MPPGTSTGTPSRSPAAAPREIGAREVIAYLRQNPDFLERHPEALRLMRSPVRDDGGDVLDFQHFMLERFRRDIARLQHEQRNLITTSRGNLASQSRVHKAVIAILGAGTFEQLLQTVTTDLAVLIDADVVTIGVESSGTPTTRLPIAGIHLLKPGTVDALLGNDREALLRADIHGDASLFGSAAGLVRSEALLRLRFSRTAPAGLLCIGTRKPETFHPGLGTELLTFLARALEITIAQWLDLGRPEPGR
jgi:uncharacterized protein YigA (DUF484 family)